MDPETVAILAELVVETGQTRNAIIRQAVQEWVARRRPQQWPAAVLAHMQVPEPLDLPPFESTRGELGEPVDVVL